MTASIWSWGGWRLVGWSTAALILLLPLLARAPWTLFDFVVMGALLVSVGLLLELAVRASESLVYRAAAAVAVAAAFLLTWIDLAVDFIGLVFLGVLAVAAAGSFVAGLRPVGMARAMVATAVAQVLIGLVATAVGSGADGGAYEAMKAAVGTAMFAALWLSSAWLFRNAAGR